MHFFSGCCAVVAAAGASERMGLGGSKQFLPLLGVPVILRTLLAFEASERVGSVVVVCRKEDLVRMKQTLSAGGVKKVCAVVAGGDTRQRSAAAGAAAVPEGTEWIAVHDGARPLVRPEEIDRCVASAQECGAAALAVPLKDTVKLGDGKGFIASTPNRSLLWAVQTPQVFRLRDYRAAMRRAEDTGADYTDDCQLLENSGTKIRLCPGSYENLKITTPEDLTAAEAILRGRGEKP